MACYCDYDALECRMRGHHRTPEVFAEYREDGEFSHTEVWDNSEETALFAHLHCEPLK